MLARRPAWSFPRMAPCESMPPKSSNGRIRQDSGTHRARLRRVSVVRDRGESPLPYQQTRRLSRGGPSRRGGEGSIQVKGPVSETLLYNLTNSYVHLLHSANPDLKHVQIDAPLLDAGRSSPSADAVGTGFSAGIDSFCGWWTISSNAPIPITRLPIASSTTWGRMATSPAKPTAGYSANGLHSSNLVWMNSACRFSGSIPTSPSS